MSRLKRFLNYALAIAGLWLLTNLVVYVSINSSYKTIESRVHCIAPEIIVAENRATHISGITTGKIINNTDTTINNQYLKIDVYSTNDIKLGTKYVKIDNLEQKASMDFKMWYKFTGAKYTTYTVVDSISNVTENDFESKPIPIQTVVGTLIVLFFT